MKEKKLKKKKFNCEERKRREKKRYSVLEMKGMRS